MRKTIFILLAQIVAFCISLDGAEPATGMLLQFHVSATNPRVLSTQNISLPVYEPARRKFEEFEARAAYYPVRTFAFDDQFKFLRKISDNVPFNWQEKETALYLVFKALPAKPDLYLLALDETHPSVKQPGDLPGNGYLFLPTNFRSESELKGSDLWKALHADHNVALAKDLTVK